VWIAQAGERKMQNYALERRQVSEEMSKLRPVDRAVFVREDGDHLR